MLLVTEAGGHAEYDAAAKRILASAPGVTDALSARIVTAERTVAAGGTDAS